MTESGYSGDTVCTVCEQIIEQGKVLPATGGVVVPETPSTDADDVSACEKDDDCVVSSFTDCDPTLWYHNGIHYCVVNGIMKGTSATTFNPNNDLTRQQIWMMLARISGEDPANMAEAKAWAVEAGISDGTNPTSSVTRQQLATMLWRYAKWAGVDVSVGEDTNILSYTDVFSVSEYAIPALQWSTATGVVGGYSDGTLRPLNIATRAQAAAMIQRFCENVLNP